MDGVPIFSLFDQLPAIHLQGFHGILNSTTNVILSEMENGLSFDESLKKAQALGIAETDATHDIDGWDAAVKTAALITVLMDIPMRLEEIHREGIRGLTQKPCARQTRRPALQTRLPRATRRDSVKASVRPEQIPRTNPMAQIAGTSSYIYFETDIFPASPSPKKIPACTRPHMGCWRILCGPCEIVQDGAIDQDVSLRKHAFLRLPRQPPPSAT